jgi:hypothetical protein
MKKYAFILIISVLLGCCKDESPVYNPSADFIMYEARGISYQWYWENVDRDSFSGSTIAFEAKDTTSGIEYEWKIGSETIKGKRAVYRDFSSAQALVGTNIPITLIASYSGRKSDTFSRKFHLLPGSEYKKIRQKANWIFTNDKNNKDTLRLRYFESPISSSYDTMYINDCKKRITNSGFIVTQFEMGFSIGRNDNWLPCNYLGSLINTFIKLDNKNKNKAYLRTEHSENGKLVLYTYTGYTVQ